MDPTDSFPILPDREDRSGRHPAERAEFYRLMVENVADVIVRGDLNLRITYVSPAVREMFGYEPEDLLGKSGYDFFHPDDRGRIHAGMASLGPANPGLTQNFRMRRENGCFVWVETRYRYVPEGNSLLAVVRDISARKRAEDMLAEANEKLADANLALLAKANCDGLTGLANRPCFDGQLLEEFRRAARQQLPLALVLIDVDHFKLFNDRYGHLAGDSCLRRVCDEIQDTLRRPGDFVARHGGGQIAVLLPASEAAGAVQIAEQMRRQIAALKIEHLDSPHRVLTISAGAAALIPIVPPDDPADLIAAAGRALSAAKKTGRNRICTVPIG